MFEKKETSLINLMLLAAIASAFQPFAISAPPVLAQASASSPTVPLPTALPTGTTVRIDGSSSMASVNQALKQRFETQFSGTSVTVGYGGTPSALQAVLDGKIDIAAIGRALTSQEKAQGLVAVPLSRGKIAIVVGANNPFNGSITDQQFAKIFRGEITDWSQVGGSPGKIRVLDRPEISDTRQALRNYPVFKAASFTSGSTTTRLSEDSTASLISQLGTDGIGYTIASQAREASGLKVLPMHNTLPVDPKYPFSQPLVYVYKGTNPSPAIAAFLGYASAPGALQAIQSAKVDPTLLAAGSASAGASALNANSAGSTAPTSGGTTNLAGSVAPTTAASPDGLTSSTVAASASAAPSPTVDPPTLADAKSTQSDGSIPLLLWWLLPLGLLGLFLLWLNNRRQVSEEGAERSIEPVAPPTQPTSSETTPIPPASDLTDPWAETPNLASRAESVISSDRASILEQPSPEIAEPALETTPNPLEDAAIAGGAALAAGAGAAAWADRSTESSPSPEEIPASVSDLVQPTELTAPAVVESPISADDATSIAGAALVGGAALATGAAGLAGAEGSSPGIGADGSSTSLEEATIEDLEIEEALSTFDTISDLEADLPSAMDEEPIELDLDEATSASGLSEVSPSIPTELIGGTALAVGAAVWTLNNDDRAQSEVEAAKFDVGQTDLSSETLASVDEGLPDLPDGYGESRIVLLPRDPQWGYAYWDISNEHKSEARQQGGQNLVLRLYDVTDVEVDRQSPHTMQQFDCDEMARDWYLAIPVSDRDYLVEIGYLTADGRWLMLARSTPVRIPPTYPSDWFEDQFVTINWQEDLRGKTFLDLVPPGKQTTADAAVVNPIYDRLFDLAKSADAQRVVGSLFGSMQQVPQQSVSSFVFAPGARMNVLPPTLSGIGMSGIGMSGIGMSGIGMAASMPPIRPRNFWLVADAELIVYGATEPDATVTIDGNPIKLNPDGTFRFQLSFQDGVIRYPIIAIAADGEQMRSIDMRFTRETPHRNTNTKNEAQDEWLF